MSGRGLSKLLAKPVLLAVRVATVQSMAAQTFREGQNSAEARALFDSRLAALARAHDVLTIQSWEGADLAKVVNRALEPFQSAIGRFVIEGGARSSSFLVIRGRLSDFNLK